MNTPPPAGDYPGRGRPQGGGEDPDAMGNRMTDDKTIDELVAELERCRRLDAEITELWREEQVQALFDELTDSD